MKMWKKILVWILFFLSIVIGSIILLVETTPGMRILLNGAAHWVPGLSIKKIEGKWRNLNLKDVQYKIPSVEVNVGEFHLEMQMKCQKKFFFCINSLELKDINMVIDRKKIFQVSRKTLTKSGKNDLGKISAPYPVMLRYLRLHNVNARINDSSTISLLDFTTGLIWQDRSLTFSPTHIQNLLVSLTKKEQFTDKKKLVQPKIQFQGKTLGEILKIIFDKPLISSSFPDFHFPFNINIEEITGKQLRLIGSTDLTVNYLLLKAKLQDHLIYIQKLEIYLYEGKLKANGWIKLVDSWPVNFTLNSALNFEPLKEENIKISLTGALRRKLQLTLNFSGSLSAKLDGQTELSKVGLPLKLKLIIPQLRWPLTGIPQYQIDNLVFSLSGKVTNYIVSLRAALKGSHFLSSHLALDGKGNIKQFTINKLRLSALKGHADLNGLVDWSKEISWNGKLTLIGMNTMQKYQNYPSMLEGKITTSGSIYGGTWKISIPEFHLRGKVNKNLIFANGTLYGNSYNQWNIPSVKIVLGRNNFIMKGMLDKALKLDASIDAPCLNNALPGLFGIVKGSLKVRGTLQVPEILANFSAIDLRWQQQALQVSQMKGFSLIINRLTLDANGNEKKHQIKLQVIGTPISWKLVLNGSFDRWKKHWHGTLNHTVLNTTVGEWRLIGPMTIDYISARQIISIGAHCWHNPYAQFCIPKSMEIGLNGYARVKLNYFDLEMLRSFFPGKTQLIGMFSGDADISWRSDGSLLTSNVTLQGNGRKITQNIEDNNLLNSKVRINNTQNRSDLSISITINNISLLLANSTLMDSGKISGILNGALHLSGSLHRPQIYGRVELSNVNVEDSGFIPVSLASVNFNVLFKGMSSTLECIIYTKKGKININGNADWSHLNNWHARITACGERVRVDFSPMVVMDISPNLVFEVSPTTFSLDGYINIPWARIIVRDIPKSAIVISPDEVFLEEKVLKSAAPKKMEIPVRSNLEIHIGDDAYLNAFGLKAKLNGDLKLMQNKHGLGLNGQINIPSGRFYAYGQDLLVRKGELHFSGPPNQPYINLESIRNPEVTENGVIAGLRITGLANEPKAEIFSEPSMPQQEALSYILHGKRFGSGSNNNTFTSSLIGFGVAQSEKVIDKIGEIFGIKNLSLSTIGIGDNQQVQISGYVLQDLEVKYGVGIFDALATSLTLRYHLMPKLYLEAVSGINQTLDLLYQFEF